MDVHLPDHWGATSYAEIHALAAQHGTPLYLYDADAVSERIEKIRSALDCQAHIYYAVKANPNLQLLRAVSSAVDGLDVSSGGEIEQAFLAGFDHGKLSYAGPGKTAEELTAAIQKGVGSISVESTGELEQCCAIASSLGLRANIALRVNPLRANPGFGLKMGGRPVQFGIDEEHLDAAVGFIESHQETLNFRGVHIYAGSQCFEPDEIVEGVKDTLRIVLDLERRSRLVCRTINLGGGFGVSHGIDGRELDLAVLARSLLPVLCDFRRAKRVSRDIVFELGRYLVGHAGLYITRVIRTKTSRGKSFYIVDGGLHHHLGAAGSFGAVLRSNYVLDNLSRPHGARTICTVAGSSCNPTDLLGIDIALPCASEGDLIGVMRAGSYGLTASPMLFLGRATPVELVKHHGEFLPARPRMTMTDFN